MRYLLYKTLLFVSIFMNGKLCVAQREINYFEDDYTRDYAKHIYQYMHLTNSTAYPVAYEQFFSAFSLKYKIRNESITSRSNKKSKDIFHYLPSGFISDDEIILVGVKIRRTYEYKNENRTIKVRYYTGQKAYDSCSYYFNNNLKIDSMISRTGKIVYYYNSDGLINQIAIQDKSTDSGKLRSIKFSNDCKFYYRDSTFLILMPKSISDCKPVLCYFSDGYDGNIYCSDAVLFCQSNEWRDENKFNVSSIYSEWDSSGKLSKIIKSTYDKFNKTEMISDEIYTRIGNKIYYQVLVSPKALLPSGIDKKFKIGRSTIKILNKTTKYSSIKK